MSTETVAIGPTGPHASPFIALQPALLRTTWKDLDGPGMKPNLPGHEPLPHVDTVSSKLPEMGKGAENCPSNSVVSGVSCSKLDIAKETLCFMGVPEKLVQLAIDNQRIEHGTSFTDAKQLYLAVQEISQSQEKQSSMIRKRSIAGGDKTEATKRMRSETTSSEPLDDNCQATGDPVTCSADVPKAASPNEASAYKLMLKNKVKMLARINHKLQQRKMCRSCLKVDLASSGTTFLPCGHFITCEICSEKFNNCPACGKNIMGTVRTFLS